MFSLEAAASCAQRKRRERGRVVNENLRPTEIIRRVGQFFPVAVVQELGPADSPHIHSAPGAEHTIHERFLAHFQ